jgi:membrane protein implicated in regulation of membrane protease activity
MSNDSIEDTYRPKGGLIQLLIGVGIIILPIIVAFVSTPPGGNALSEGGGGAAIWLMFYSIPIGGVVAIMGLKKFYRENATRPKAKKIMTGSLIGCCAGVPVILIIIIIIGVTFFSQSHH